MSNTAEIYKFPEASSAEQSFEDYWEGCRQYCPEMTKGRAYQLFHMSPEEYFQNAGWVYVLANGLMAENVFKVGRTTKNIELRMRQLYTTGVPMEFDCMYADWFPDCIRAEAFIHKTLEPFRISESREFFHASINEIEWAFLTYAATGEMAPDHMVGHISARSRHAAAHEQVNGVLVSKKPTTLEVPF
ncbi:GIY-YIG nuclease family protein [Halomonas sp. McH1-25]|uniref:GIY-YIG nuclease family protein n=1 Tax=unclassified Halomonas TaxID=2609666 RepID=UPI001EF6CE3B|nr:MULTISPECIES: GIY-YIG nuclease family protein [unclassified Halomonas]MCG7598845.1 GIY-YIG nuclease family protein [Halomonas sp. McH1-25]MCP1340808.1 GIY-YIG nuclease family protein [Halomonas sp. FL8]MCP1361309.1 GIY-YIG nuclease family protein [Halomonas sp. BBD45]MCP1366606.1 GIY-YIG nuclease family protein [Halomonas sp. BBD48]